MADKPDHWRPPKAGGRNYGGGSTPVPKSGDKAPSPTAKTTVVKTAAKKAPPAKKAAAKKAASSGVKKAAAAEAAGGGPEDPIADVAAAGGFLSSLRSGAKKAKGTAGAAGEKVPAGNAFAASSASRWVLVEFLVCFTVLGLGTIVAPGDRKNGGAAHIAVKGSALALLFFILALMAGGGPKAKKTAEGLGALVAITYLFTSTDAAALVTWISSFFAKPGKSATEAGGAIGDLGSAVAGAAQ